MKALFTGAGIAAAAGILMGAAAKPDLGWDDRPAGPQMLAAWGGGRSSGPFDDGASFAAYKGSIPDYVLGSDWQRSLQAPVEAPAPRIRETRVASYEPPADSPDMPLTHASYDEPTPLTPSYPSLQGGAPASPPAEVDGTS